MGSLRLRLKTNHEVQGLEFEKVDWNQVLSIGAFLCTLLPEKIVDEIEIVFLYPESRPNLKITFTTRLLGWKSRLTLSFTESELFIYNDDQLLSLSKRLSRRFQEPFSGINELIHSNTFENIILEQLAWWLKEIQESLATNQSEVTSLSEEITRALETLS